VEVVTSLSQGRTAAAQCGLFTYKSVPVIFEPPLQWKPTRCTISQIYFSTELYMSRTDLLSIIRSLNTVFTAIGICHASYVNCSLARS